jgi:hypothetical protein
VHAAPRHCVEMVLCVSLCVVKNWTVALNFTQIV